MTASHINAGIKIFSKSLLVFFVGTVTLWYFITPYLVRPHPKFREDFNNYISRLKNPEEKQFVENWTKWRLYLGESDSAITLGSFEKTKLDLNSSVPAVFEWRKEYKSQIYRSADGGDPSVEHSLPWYSEYGLYNHFYTEQRDGNLLFMPRFMFGSSKKVLDEMYDGGESIPIIGMMTDNTRKDRLLVQCFMNLVTLSIIFLLWANNTPLPDQKRE